jgi:putative flippase GtrA
MIAPKTMSFSVNLLAELQPRRLLKIVPDLLAVSLLLALPVVVFWAFWAGNPADRLMMKGDILMQGYPSRFFVHRLFNQGELPLWNPYQLAGMPLLGDVQVAVYYLPNLALDLLYLGRDLPYQAFEGLVIAHYVLGALLFYGYLRNLGLSTAPALIGAIAFQFNGFFVGHRGHYNMFGVVVWIPGVMWMLDRAWAQTGYTSRAILWTALAGLALSQMVMAGHPQLTMYGVLFIIAYFGYRWLEGSAGWQNWWHSSSPEKLQHPLVQKPLLFCVSGVLAGAIAAVALLPTAELLGRSMRSEPTYRFSAEYSLLPRNFVTLLMPEFLDWSGTEFRIYAGILTLALAVVAWTVTRRSRSELRFYLTVMIAATVVALGGFTVFQGFAYNYLPGFGQVRVSVRAFFFANFALSVMAAFGAETLLRQLDDLETTRLAQLVRYGRRLMVLGGAVAILLYLLLVWNFEAIGEIFYTRTVFTTVSSDQTFAFLTQTTNQFLLFLTFFGATVLLLWARWANRLHGPKLGLALGLLITLDLATYAPSHDTITADPDQFAFTHKNFNVELYTDWWQIQDQEQLIETLSQYLGPARLDNNAEVLPNNYSQVWSLPFNSGYNILDLQARFDLQHQWPLLSNTQKWDLFNVGYILAGPDVTDPPEVGAAALLQNSMGTLWQRANQPAYATFNTGIRPMAAPVTVNGWLDAFPQSYQNRPAVAASDASLRETLAKHWPEPLNPDYYQIGRTGKYSPVDISVLSGGKSAPYSAIVVNGETVSPEQRGLVMALIDPVTGEIIASDGFDTYLSAAESDRFAAAVSAVPAGTIAALATYEEGTAKLTDNARLALADLGAVETLRDQFGAAYALIGIKGSNPGTALEQLGPNPIMLDVGIGAASLPTAETRLNLLEYRPNQITLLVNNPVPGLLTISEAVYPGWTAFVNGQPTPILQANGLFRSVVLPAALDEQPHEVTFVYAPASFRLGAAVSVIGLSLVMGLLAANFIYSMHSNSSLTGEKMQHITTADSSQSFNNKIIKLSTRLLQHRELKRLGKYGLVGAFGAVVDMTTLNTLIFALGWTSDSDKMIANIISVSMAIISNYILNRMWTFPETRNRQAGIQFLQFVLVSLSGLLINSAIFYAADQFFFSLFFSDLMAVQLAKLVSIGIVMFWNFGINRVWTFQGV